jgi:phosphate transport system permease protein
VQANDPPLLLAMEEQGEVAIRVARSGQVSFFKAQDGQPVLQQQLPIPAGVEVTSFSVETPNSRRFVVGLSNGQVLIAQHNYKVTYPNDVRLIPRAWCSPTAKSRSPWMSRVAR